MKRFPSCHRVRGSAVAGLIGAALALGNAMAQTPLGSELPPLLEQARIANPEVQSMRLEADAARLRVGPAGALPDPVLRVELENLNNFDRTGREARFTLMQSLPAWGKRGLKEQVAEADAEQARARSAATWTELAMRVKTAHAQLYLAAGSERLTREVLDLLARLEQIAQARYAGGLVPQQDAIRAQMEQTATRSELLALEREKAQARARLNALLGRAPQEPLADPALLRPLPDAGSLDLAALATRARAANPLLQVEQARLQGAEKSRELTWRNRYPDFNVGVSPTQMGTRGTAWGVMLELNIPLQQTVRRAQEAEAGTMVAAARARAEAVANQLAGDLAEQLAALQAAQRTASLLRSQLLPQSEASLQSALAAYENAKADFATLLDAQRQIRNARLDLLKAESEAQMRLAEIERTVGEDL